MSETSAAKTGRPWGQAALWLAALAAFFYVSYGFANWLAAQRADVPTLVFGWERSIPFLAWTIIPYWSINLFYGASLFACRDRAELATHVRRLLTCQIVAVACFILFPLQLAFGRPETGGFSGFLFEALTAFDRPYNLAPSLHVALLVVLWDLYARRAPRALRLPLHLWFALIGISVLTTYQHHFFDVPTGLLLGIVALWLWPADRPSPLARVSLTAGRRRWRIAGAYGTGAAVCFALALAAGGIALWLMWPAVSLLLVAACYAGLGTDGFQKSGDGRMTVAARLLLAPYRAAARANAWLWTRTDRETAEVADGVFIGPLPLRRSANGFGTIIDLTAEM
ncbi:MAG TPA: phosphatase PAP2 family protein, partial [Dongiaceae bacterium]